LARRRLFSQVAEFELYDLTEASGAVNENVYAYSNRAGADRALVFFHNAFAECRGWVKQSAGKAVAAGVEGGAIRSRTLGEALALNGEEGVWYLFREHVSGLEFLRSGRELCADGMYVELRAFQYQVFLEFREERDASGAYDRLARALGGRGVPDVREALRELALRPLHEAAAALLSELEHAGELFHGAPDRDLARRVLKHFERAAAEVRRIATGMEPVEVITAEFTRDLASLSAFLGSARTDPALGAVTIPPAGRDALLLAWAAWHRLHRLAAVAGDPIDAPERRLRLAPVWREGLRRAGLTEDEALRALALFALPVPYDGLAEGTAEAFNAAVLALLETESCRSAIGLNEYRGVRYYRKEEFENVLKWFYTVGVVAALAADPARLGRLSGLSGPLAAAASAVLAHSDRADYRLDALERLLAGPPRPGDQPS
jgi:hypothetical protein